MSVSSLAVLISGGIDSAILLAEAARTHDSVAPVYVRSGLYWENAELEHLGRFMTALNEASLEPLRILELRVDDLLPGHWSVTGRDVPGDESPDEAVFLPGRNALLLAKAMLYCQLQDIPAVALATLRGNPFPDATPEFFDAYQDALNRGLGGQIRILRPFAQLSKVEVMRRGSSLPLELTFSCINPVAGEHCGVCNKCAERRLAFARAVLEDRTAYRRAGSLRTGCVG